MYLSDLQTLKKLYDNRNPEKFSVANSEEGYPN